MIKRILCKKENCNIWVEHPNKEERDIKGYATSVEHYHSINEENFLRVLDILNRKEELIFKISKIMEEEIYGVKLSKK